MINRLSRYIVLLGSHAVASRLELVGLLVAFFNLLVVFEVGEELAPRDEFFVVDGVVLLRQLHHLVHLVTLDLIEHLF